MTRQADILASVLSLISGDVRPEVILPISAQLRVAQVLHYQFRNSPVSVGV